MKNREIDELRKQISSLSKDNKRLLSYIEKEEKERILSLDKEKKRISDDLVESRKAANRSKNAVKIKDENSKNSLFQRVIQEKSVKRRLRLSRYFAAKTWQDLNNENKQICLIGNNTDNLDFFDRYDSHPVVCNPDKESWNTMQDVFLSLMNGDKDCLFVIMSQEWEMIAAFLEILLEGDLSNVFVHKLINRDVNEKRQQENTWEDIKELCKNLPLYLVTNNERAEDFLSKLKDDFTVSGVITGKKKDVGSEWMGYKLISCYEIAPDRFENGDAIFIICSVNWNDFINRFEGKGFSHIFSLRLLCRNHPESIYSRTWQNTIALMGTGIFGKDFDNDRTEKVISLLADEDSIITYKTALEMQKNGKDDYDYIVDDLTLPDPPYFTRSFFHFGIEEVYLDIGTQDGDTINDFIWRVGNKFKLIYAWEIGGDSLKKLYKKFVDPRIKILPFGAWYEDTIMKIEGSGESRRLSGPESESQNLIECKRIDSIISEPVTMIKMDVEGAEMNALRGAKQVINKYRPKLAISIYHKYEDMWDIPLYIHSLVPEYKFYLRHHRNYPTDTVLYATV